MKLAEKVERCLRNGFASVKLKQTIPCRGEMPTMLAVNYFNHALHFNILRSDGLQSFRDIRFITVADLTAHGDCELTMDIRLSEVDINLAIFELHGDEEQIEPSETTRLRIAHDAHDTHDGILRPQTKILNLPNRSLHGIWDS